MQVMVLQVRSPEHKEVRSPGVHFALNQTPAVEDDLERRRVFTMWPPLYLFFLFFFLIINIILLLAVTINIYVRPISCEPNALTHSHSFIY